MQPPKRKSLVKRNSTGIQMLEEEKDFEAAQSRAVYLAQKVK